MAKHPHKTTRVSDHAVLRYLERGMKLNIEMVRQHIADLCSGPAAIGAVCVRSEGLRFEIVNAGDAGYTITTVTPDRDTPGRTSQQRNQRFIERRTET